MSDDFGDLDVPTSGVGIDTGPDPWLHFTITAEAEDEPEPEAARDEPDQRQAGPVAGGSAPAAVSSPSDAISAGWGNESGVDLDAASMLAAELFRKRRRGDTASFSEDMAPLRSLGASIAGLMSCPPTYSLGAAPSGRERILRLPDVGDTLFGFHLRYPLGRGAFARVFLAEQSNLAGRPVVLKVSAIEGSEPQTLAQLQHTNIVPIHSVHEDHPIGLRAVCMPYFGGASLASLLEQAWAQPSVPIQGAALVRALAAVQSPPPANFRNGVKIDLAGIGRAREDGDDPSHAGTDPPPADVPVALERFGKWSYIQATAWIAAEIAEGLKHAHQRGIFHRDIKPSNILISAEGQPLLLDFNLAQDQALDPAQATLGGTVAYMAPEHLRALAGRSPVLIRKVDERSDIYSLGMVLAEMLTGQRPFDQSASYSAVPLQLEAMAVERSRLWPAVRERRPDIPWGIESIVRKCLAPDPGLRYQQADHLAEDLRRFLDDRPLRYAPELSRAEQVRKFARRHPRLTSSGTVVAAAAIALLAIGWVLVGFRDRLGAAQAREKLRTYEQGTTEALCLINTVLEIENQEHLREGVRVCERTLQLYGLPPGSRWEDQSDLGFYRADERRKLAEDRRELLMLLAGAQIRLAPNDPTVRRRALGLLEQAEAIDGLAPSRALWLERGDNLEHLGETVRAAEARRTAANTPASTARDHYALATVYARQGGAENLRRALDELDLALMTNPRHYWSVVQRGICHFELCELLPAAADFGQSIGLWPESPWGYFNRGCVLERDGRKTDAIADYTTALRRDPGFAPAAINRGWAFLKLKRYAEALADFDRARVLGRRDGMLDAGRGIALEGLRRHGEADLAFAAAFAQAAPRPDAARVRLCWQYGCAVAHRLPAKARAAFDDVLLTDPRHPEALYGRAMLATAAGSDGEAIAALDRALGSNPGFNQARSSRAVLLARKGDWEHAAQDINWCLEREPTSGESLYAAACVAALAARPSRSPQAIGQAVELLRRALDAGVPAARAAVDPDLDAIRRDPRIEMLLARATGPGRHETHGQHAD
jgi:serine/threonine protein kinase/tetratricopeptide (TPR) repeat protein